MVSKAERNRIAVNVWTARIIPMVLAGVVGYATWVLVVLLCVKYLLVEHNNASAAIPILAIYFFLFILMTASFLRLVQITIWEPPYVPLGPLAQRERSELREKGKGRIRESGISTGEYVPSGSSGGTSTDTTGARDDLDSPGLELFYTKDVFICGVDGRPKWCSECANWKPDRAHHSSDAGRCIQRMDHFCPWVGGPIGENNFKFFIQFTGYTAFYCLHLLVVMAIYVHKQLVTEGEQLNSHFAAIIGLAGFFGLFTAGMTGTSLDLALNNLTQVEKLAWSNKVHILAILKPPIWELLRINPYMASHLSYPEIKYPLENNHPNQAPGPKAKDYAQNGADIAILEEYQDHGTRNRYHAESSTGTDGAGEPPSTTPEAHHSESRLERIPNEVLARLHSSGARLLPSDLPIEESVCNPEKIEQGEDPRKKRRDRDRMASRIFAILRMEEGVNPWDLGSHLSNFRSVMGTNFFDYLLPIKRSPCCNHEDPESHFQVGPYVDLLRANVYFKEPKNARLRCGHKVSGRNVNISIEDLGKQLGHRPRQRRRRRRRRSHTSKWGNDGLASDNQPSDDRPMEMGNISGRHPATIPAS